MFSAEFKAEPAIYQERPRFDSVVCSNIQKSVVSPEEQAERFLKALEKIRPHVYDSNLPFALEEIEHELIQEERIGLSRIAKRLLVLSFQDVAYAAYYCQEFSETPFERLKLEDAFSPEKFSETPFEQLSFADAFLYRISSKAKPRSSKCQKHPSLVSISFSRLESTLLKRVEIPRRTWIRGQSKEIVYSMTPSELDFTLVHSKEYDLVQYLDSIFKV